ncbi:ZYRO0G13838p [Zygosaccharomyces rouxii]|uniref:ZYRO0G13838p n=1 Tax=Zygosaccharomyces rouxii (strain ATCC 2623 / CBS 732 / NBRC 1130 / NCYC 568 / NRRL Y-229) TaxID=559307 RepID=C5E0M0_ZYGRC|nr:uncharacterized protein ZYRO0G13838g [Zygosaccharomyces rouxii]CAR29654.1 ZYRO0G13838p [Zygosaccharomyces rouxii]
MGKCTVKCILWHFDMDGKLQNRLDNVGAELEWILDPSKISRKVRFSAVSPSDKILKKWKYRPRETRSNRFLDRVKLCPYENVVLTVRKNCPGFNLHSYDNLIDRCKRIQDGTREQWLDWDNVWINPISLSSKGWDFSSSQNGNLVCKCVTCSNTLCLQLNSGSQLNKRYWEKYVSSEHSIDCPWRKNQFDLVNEYYLQSWNLVRELERISRSRVSKESALFSGKLQSLFQIDDESLKLCLQGYELVEEDVVQCTGCHKRAFTKSILRDQINFHAEWCKYYNCEKLGEMIEKSVVLPMDKDINGRLKLLENYFETM